MEQERESQAWQEDRDKRLFHLLVSRPQKRREQQASADGQVNPGRAAEPQQGRTYQVEHMLNHQTNS
jgi:hypothetical protein